MRKLDLYEDAIPLANELEQKCEALDWCRNEVIWVYTNGILKTFNENATLDEVLPIANRIMKLHPDGLAAKLVVFKVIKAAKNVSEWEVVNDWASKIDPKDLSTRPMKDDRGKEGWCDQSLWYNYRLNGLYESKKFPEVVRIADEAIPKFTKEKRFFLRLKALALHKLGKTEDSIAIFDGLCKHPKTDWWLLKEYADVMKDFGEPEKAYELMRRAARQGQKLEMMVSLFSDFGFLCRELKKDEEGYCYLLLSKLIREKNSWKVQPDILSAIDQLKTEIEYETFHQDIKSLYQKGKSYWDDAPSVNEERMHGEVRLGSPEKPFCLIYTTDRKSHFCFKRDLPKNLKDGDRVSFRIVPSFDKKKNVQSSKAVDISFEN